MSESKNPKRPAALDPRVVSLMRGRTDAERFNIAAQAELLGEAGLDAVFGQVQPGTANLEQVVGGRPLHHWLGKTRKSIEREVAGDKDALTAIEAALDSANMPAPASLERATTADISERRQATGDNPAPVGAPRDDAGQVIPTNLLREQNMESLAEASERGESIGDARASMTAGGFDGTRARGSAADAPVSNVGRGVVDGTLDTLNNSGGAGGAGNEPTFGDDEIPLSELPESDDELLAIEGIGPATVEKIKEARKAKRK